VRGAEACTCAELAQSHRKQCSAERDGWGIPHGNRERRNGRRIHWIGVQGCGLVVAQLPVLMSKRWRAAHGCAWVAAGDDAGMCLYASA